MNNKTSIIFLGIFVASAILIGYMLISSVSNKLNEFNQQINNVSAYYYPESSGFQSDPVAVESDNENSLNK